MDPKSQWLDLFLGDKPVFKEKATKKPGRGRTDPDEADPPHDDPS